MYLVSVVSTLWPLLNLLKGVTISLTCHTSTPQSKKKGDGIVNNNIYLKMGRPAINLFLHDVTSHPCAHYRASINLSHFIPTRATMASTLKYVFYC